jgi:hypothetical protein
MSTASGSEDFASLRAKRKNFEMAVIPFLWLLLNQKFYQNVFRITLRV